VLKTPSSADARTIPAPETILSASVDEGGYLWAVSSSALYLLRPSAASFERYPNNAGEIGTAQCSTGPCQNGGLQSIAGAGPGEAWLGYTGLFLDGNEADDPSVPLSIRESGGAERFFAVNDSSGNPAGIQRDKNIGQLCATSTNPDGSVPAPVPTLGHLVFCTPPGVLSAEPSGRWKMRTIWTIAFNHGPSGYRGDVFFGGNHGLAQWNHTRELRDRFAMQEHQHAGYDYWQPNQTPQDTLLCGDHAGVVIDPASGNVWTGAAYGVARLHYMDGLPGGDFYAQNIAKDAYDYLFPYVPYTYAKGVGFQTWGCTAGVSTCQSLSQDNAAYGASYHPSTGGRDFVQSMSFDAWGNLWIASYINGLARVPMMPGADKSGIVAATSQRDLLFWNHNRGGLKPGWPQQAYDFAFAVLGDPDGSIWVGTRDFGAYRFVAQTGQWISYAAVVPGKTITQIALDPRPTCNPDAPGTPAGCIPRRAVVFASEKGVTVYTGP
jgi:hypothetical protein